MWNFYPRSPCGERLHYDNYNLHCVEISIHALLAESDVGTSQVFQRIAISIHALLAESDVFSLGAKADSPTFLSTLSLRRATLATWKSGHVCRDFYPRSPCGERLWANFSGFYWWVISIHALLAESDDNLTQGVFNLFAFLSTLSLRRATIS